MSLKWYFNASPKALGTQGTSYSIGFTSAGTHFSVLRNGTVFKEKFYLYYDDTEAYKSGWKNSGYRTITFDEEPTGALLTYLEANATAVQEDPYKFKHYYRNNRLIGTGQYRFRPFTAAEPPAVFEIINALTNVTADGENPTTIAANDSVTLIYTANSGYTLPETITVTGASYTWEQSTGVLDISNPTGDVTITIVGVASSLSFKLPAIKPSSFIIEGASLLTDSFTVSSSVYSALTSLNNGGSLVDFGNSHGLSISSSDALLVPVGLRYNYVDVEYPFVSGETELVITIPWLFRDFDTVIHFVEYDYISDTCVDTLIDTANVDVDNHAIHFNPSKCDGSTIYFFYYAVDHEPFGVISYISLGILSDGENPTFVTAGDIGTVFTFSTYSGYVLPDEVIVVNASFVYDKIAGTVTISNPVGDVIIMIYAVSS